MIKRIFNKIKKSKELSTVEILRNRGVKIGENVDLVNA